eukprot:CAMPEP_0182533044 /NCGR_PEP_ID=MMETSP1323-20130603/12955_1 /TAXON_ID=236787 /ORGANISM="Florenciella parvula, Strain RCC1693" /LENGTH=84 /DNA_ID=CAMNT_0024742873 /DNA_START=144 /DNA_END=394 /DNA_ORIENTATION=+
MGLVRLLMPPDGDLHGHPPPVGGGGRPRGVERREGETRGEKYGFDKPGIFGSASPDLSVSRTRAALADTPCRNPAVLPACARSA